MLWMLADASGITAEDVLKIVKGAQISAASIDPFSMAWWLQNFGPTGVILFLIGAGAWKVWSFLKPIILKVGEGHVQLMESLGASQAEHGVKLSSIQAEQAQQRSLLNDIHNGLAK